MHLLSTGAPCDLSAGSATFSFSSAEGHYSVPYAVGEFKHATSERARWMSNLRSFLRLAVFRFMALVRPRDCGSLTGGMVDDPLWRHALYSVMHRQSGPSRCCTFGRRWSLPEVQGGSREPHAPLVVLPGERAVQVTVELVGPCSCQISRLIASHTCAYKDPAGRLGRALPERVPVSLELFVVLCC